MGNSIKLGNVFGIPVRLHWTFLILPYFYLLAADGSPLEALLMLVMLFGSVFLHELGHCLAARRFGIGVIDITFWPLGGMARMTAMPEVPKVEGLVAIAGPAVNFALAALAMGTGTAGSLLGFDAPYLLVVFAVINVVMGVFNLVPAFPMDGGRILRAWFARGADWVTATEQAVAVGRFFAVLMFLASLVITLTTRLTMCALPLVAVFVWFAGARELLAVRLRHGQGIFGAAGTDPLRTEWSPPDPAEWTREDDEPRGARRPTVWETPAPSGGFSERAIQQLERFRGRLRRD